MAVYRSLWIWKILNETFYSTFRSHLIAFPTPGGGPGLLKAIFWKLRTVVCLQIRNDLHHHDLFPKYADFCQGWLDVLPPYSHFENVLNLCPITLRIAATNRVDSETRTGEFLLHVPRVFQFRALAQASVQTRFMM